MAKLAFTDSVGLSPRNLEKLDVVNDIIEEYAAAGYRLTLRQLYYQLVSRDIIPNKTAEYSKLSTLLTKGRMAGLVDWNAIEDRIRKPQIPYWVRGISDALEDTISQYRLDRMKGQDTYLEVWCEKDALSGVLSRITNEYHIRLMVNRGYSSTTAMFDAACRMGNKPSPTILYLGDHDPSGLDMIRDISHRLAEFDVDVEVIPIALTKDQIEEFAPPPNPAKITDPRADWYIAEHGPVSWEVDALPPKTLDEVLVRAILDNINIAKYDRMCALEEEHRDRLQDLSDEFEGEDDE